MSSTNSTISTTSAISIFPAQQRQTQSRRSTVNAATKSVPLVGVDIDFDMTMSMGDVDMHMGSLGNMGIDMNMGGIDMTMGGTDQHLMSWSPRPTNSFQNRFYPGASPGSLFNPIAMPAPNISSSPISVNFKRFKSNSHLNSKLTNKPKRRFGMDRRGGGGNGGETDENDLDLEGVDGDGEDEGRHGEDAEGDGEDVDRDWDAPNSLTLPAQGGNYTCCGVTLPDLHALVDHFENAHVQVFASPSLEALSVASSATTIGSISAASASVNATTGASAAANVTSPSTPVSAVSAPSVSSSASTANSTSSSSTSSPAPYEFPATPFDTDDMDIALSDGPSPSPPLTPATTPSPTTSAFDPIRVVYHPAGVGMGTVAGGYGMTTTMGTGMTMGMNTRHHSHPTHLRHLSPTTPVPTSVSGAPTHLPYFRPSTYSSLAGGNGPVMSITTAGAFNRYAGYSEYSSNLPGTDPSPSYPFQPNGPSGPSTSSVPHSGPGPSNSYSYALTGTTSGTSNGLHSASSSSSCLPPALLFSSSAEPSPHYTPSSSRTGSPVQGNILPNGTLPLHPSSTTSSSTNTSIAPSRRTPPPSSLPSTASAASSSSGSSHPLSKPFKCPKPGCNKSYKQQNGLKYHLSHGQCNFAPRDPEVEKLSEQEREKRIRPFVCKVPVAVPGGGPNGSTGVVECGRRYKNMNGLRYHYQHTGEHGAMGLEMLAQGRHPLPELPTNSSPSSNVSTPTTPTTPSMPTSQLDMNTIATLSTLNTAISSSSLASTPPAALSTMTSPHASPILSVPATPITPLSPNPLRISTSTTTSSISMPPSPSRYYSSQSQTQIPIQGQNGFTGMGLGLGRSISHPSSPVTSTSSMSTGQQVFQQQSEHPVPVPILSIPVHAMPKYSGLNGVRMVHGPPLSED